MQPLSPTFEDARIEWLCMAEDYIKATTATIDKLGLAPGPSVVMKSSNAAWLVPSVTIQDPTIAEHPLPSTMGVFGSLHRVGPHRLMQYSGRLVRCTVAQARPHSCIWPPRAWPDANAGWGRSSQARPRACKLGMMLGPPRAVLTQQLPPLQRLQLLARLHSGLPCCGGAASFRAA